MIYISRIDKHKGKLALRTTHSISNKEATSYTDLTAALALAINVSDGVYLVSSPRKYSATERLYGYLFKVSKGKWQALTEIDNTNVVHWPPKT